MNVWSLNSAIPMLTVDKLLFQNGFNKGIDIKNT